MTEDKSFERWRRAQAVAVWLEAHHAEGDVEIGAFRVRCPQYESGPWLVIMLGVSADGTPMVAFHEADTLEMLFAGMLNRWMAKQFKWRVDEYRSG